MSLQDPTMTTSLRSNKGSSLPLRPVDSSIKSVHLSAAIAAGLTVILFAAGFVFGWDPGAGARTDLYRYHLPTTYAFRMQPWLSVVRNYRSATTPLFHMLESFNPFLGHDSAFRASNSMLSLMLCATYLYALRKRFGHETEMLSWSLLVSATLLASPYFESMAYWPITDTLPLWFLIITFLIVRPFLDVPTRNLSTGRAVATICCGALCSAAAFYTRQSYLFLSLYCLVVLLQTLPRLRLLTLGIFAAVAVPGIYLVTLWRGFTPPSFQTKHQGMSATIVVYPLTMVAFYAIPFLMEIFCQTRSLRALVPGSIAAWLKLVAGAIVFLLLFSHFTFTGHESGGGIASKIFQRCGPPGPILFLLFAYGGLLLLVKFMRAADWRTRLLVVCFALPTLTMKVVFQRYYDPVLYILFFVYCDRRIVRKFVNIRSGFILLAFSLILLCGCLFYHSAESPAYPLFGKQVPWTNENPTGDARIPYQ